jgi:molecular chaperone HscB
MSSERTHFDLFELPQRYALDADELERRYRERSRHWHPDRFSRAPAAERTAVLARATDLNEAYRVLRSDARRAQYLLGLRGIDVNQEGPQNKLTMDPEFLASILELREALMEARAEGDQAQLAALHATVQRRMGELKGSIARGFARLEAEPASDAPLTGLVQDVLSQRYYQRFCDDIAEYQESQADLATAP